MENLHIVILSATVAYLLVQRYARTTGNWEPSDATCCHAAAAPKGTIQHSTIITMTHQATKKVTSKQNRISVPKDVIA